MSNCVFFQIRVSSWEWVDGKARLCESSVLPLKKSTIEVAKEIARTTAAGLADHVVDVEAVIEGAEPFVYLRLCHATAYLPHVVYEHPSFVRDPNPVVLPLFDEDYDQYSQWNAYGWYWPEKGRKERTSLRVGTVQAIGIPVGYHCIVWERQKDGEERPFARCYGSTAQEAVARATWVMEARHK